MARIFMTSVTSAWQFWALLSAAFAAMTAILAKLGVRDIDPDLATLLRTLVVVALLAFIVAMRGAWAIGPDGLSARGVLFLVLSGFATGASWLCYFRALKLGDASQVAPIDKLSVVLVAIFAAIFLAERPSATAWTGIALIGLGAVLVARG